MKKNHPDKHKKISELFELDDFWSDFEDHMANSFESIENIIDKESDSFEHSLEEFDEEWRHDSDKSEAIEEFTSQRVATSDEISVLLKEWLSDVTVNAKKSNITMNVLNFNYTDYLTGDNVINIHGNIKSDEILEVGHTRDKVAKENEKSMYGNSLVTAGSFYNEMQKDFNSSLEKLEKYLLDKSIREIIFFGFSFGEQDMNYFSIFDKKIKVEFYLYEDHKNIEELKERMHKIFDNVKFRKATG